MRALATAAVVVLVAVGCASGPKPTAHYTTPPETTGGVSLESPRTQQIELARVSNPRLFRIFPAAPGRRDCRISEGGLHKKPVLLPATCETSIHAAATHEPALVVSFTERFSLCGAAYCPPSAALHHTWRVILGEPMVTPTARLRVLATRNSGAPAPQAYK